MRIKIITSFVFVLVKRILVNIGTIVTAKKVVCFNDLSFLKVTIEVFFKPTIVISMYVEISIFSLIYEKIDSKH